MSYTLEVAVTAGSSAADAFTALKTELKTKIKDTDALKNAIAAEMGSSVVLDKASYQVRASTAINDPFLIKFLLIFFS